MAGIFKAIGSWLKKKSARKQVGSCSTPQISFGDGTLSKKDLFQDPAFRRILEVLNEYNPILVSQLYADVIPAAGRAQVEMEELGQQKTRMATLEAEKAKAEASIQPLPSELHVQENQPNKVPYRTPQWYGLLTLGLSFMLLLGLNDITTGKQLRNLRPADYPIVGLNWLAASCLTLGIKQVMSKAGKQSFRYEPNRSFSDEPTYPDSVAWWLRYGKGDGSLWLGLAFVSLETCFAAPGLVAMLRPDLAAQLAYQVAMTATAALAATVNVSFGWHSGVEEARHLYNQEEEEREFKAKLEELRQSDAEQELVERNTEFARQIEAAVALLAQLHPEIANQKEIVSDARARARLENERWEHAVKLWLSMHPNKVEEFSQQRQLAHRLTQNGHVADSIPVPPLV